MSGFDKWLEAGIIAAIVLILAAIFWQAVGEDRSGWECVEWKTVQQSTPISAGKTIVFVSGDREVCVQWRMK